MPMYRDTIGTVEAFQVPTEGDYCSDEMQAFLSRTCPDAESLGDGSIRVHCLGAPVDAGPGEWITVTNTGTVYVYTAGYFDKFFGPVAEPVEGET